MSLVKQSHRFLTPVTIIYFVLLHKTVGRVKSTFCVSYLLYLLWKRTNSPPTLSFSQFKHPLLLPALQLTFIGSAVKAFARIALCRCWEPCWDRAGVWQQHMSLKPSSVPVLRVLTGTHLATRHTLKACAIAFDGTMCPLKSKPATAEPGL